MSAHILSRLTTHSAAVANRKFVNSVFKASKYPGAAAQNGRFLQTSSKRYLLASALVSTMALSHGNNANAQQNTPPWTDISAPCSTPDGGITANCSGDLSEGVQILGDVNYSVLNIDNINGDIGDITVPTMERSAIRFIRDNEGDVEVNVNAGDFKINNNSQNSPGINYWNAGILAGSGKNGNVTVNAIGDIETDSYANVGIAAFSSNCQMSIVGSNNNACLNPSDSHDPSIVNQVSITHIGDIKTSSVWSHGVLARGWDTDVSVVQTGNIVIAEQHGRAIEAIANNSAMGSVRAVDVNVIHTGDIKVSGKNTYGLWFSAPGNVNVTQVGDVLVEDGHASYALTTHGQITFSKTGKIETTDLNWHALIFKLQTGNATINLGQAAIDIDGNVVSGATVLALDDSDDGTSFGIEISGGTTNILNMYNEVRISGADLDIRARVSDGDQYKGNETINNYGTLTSLGVIDLDWHGEESKDTIQDDNNFNNYGVFNSGTLINLGEDFIDKGGNLFSNWGMVSVAGNGVFGTTAITGNWVGYEGSGLRIDAVLDDGSSGQNDMITISGSTSGTTLVYVVNQGGEGGITGQGATDGILVIDVEGASEGEFQLAQQVFVGAYEFQLVKADDQDWYLQSRERPEEEEDPEEGEDPEAEEDPEEEENLETREYLVSDAGIASAQMPLSLRSFGGAMTGSRSDRANAEVGAQANNRASNRVDNAYGLAFGDTTTATAADPNHNMWARMIGSKSNADTTVNGPSLSGDVSFDETFWAIQGGIKALSEDGTLAGSLFMHYGGIDTDHTNETLGRAAGSSTMEAWGGGASLTLMDPAGYYLDGALAITSYDIDMVDSNGDEASTNALGWSASGEAGWHMAPINNVSMTPQLQLIYQAIAIESFDDAGGSHVTFSDEDSLELRAGTTLEFSFEENVNLYSKLNILLEFLETPVAQLGGVPVSLGLDDTGYEVRLGIKTGRKDTSFAAWAEVNYRGPFGDGAKSWAATGGISLRF